MSKAVHLRNNETCNLTNGGCDAKLHSLLSIGQLAAVLGVSVSTVRRWCREGRLKELCARQTTIATLLTQTTSTCSMTQTTKPAEKIGYASVSGHNQKADLETQAQRLRDYGCDGVITGLGYGLNCRKPGLKRLMSALLSDEVETLVLTHENRVSELNSSLPSAVGRRHRL